MQQTYQTKRLALRKLNLADTNFIFELLNTDGWIKFIGNRNINTKEDANNYIQRILNNAAVDYRVVSLLADETPVGLVTLIKRDYLDHHDIGFAFLPAYSKQGYAFEASQEVLNDLLASGEHSAILATTIPENNSSIQLLKKLGLHFEKKIINEGEVLHVFAITKNN